MLRSLLANGRQHVQLEHITRLAPSIDGLSVVHQVRLRRVGKPVEVLLDRIGLVSKSPVTPHAETTIASHGDGENLFHNSLLSGGGLKTQKHETTTPFS